ncbi:MAG: hypothetical protein GXP14_07925 [Gammaproteobacteria bacterium]|nr:hypothetical protein [Gammaproteobacteria bacterium]
MRASGTLLLQNTHGATPTQGLDNLKFSAQQQAETTAGKLFSETTLKFNDKTKTVSFSNKFTTQSNLPNHPSVSLAFETNAQGKLALIGSMTQDLVKGKLGNHTFIGRKLELRLKWRGRKTRLKKEKIRSGQN